MNKTPSKRLRSLCRGLLAAAGLAAALLPPAAQAQAWPTKQPIHLVAVFPPGGSVDQVARMLAPLLQQKLGQTVVVDNKGGASASIGTAAVAPAKTPPEHVKRMHDEIDAALRLPDVVQKLAAQGIVINHGTPAAAQAFIEGQVDTWAKVVKANNIKAD